MRSLLICLLLIQLMYIPPQSYSILVKSNSHVAGGEHIWGNWYLVKVEAESAHNAVAKAKMAYDYAEEDGIINVAETCPTPRWYIQNVKQLGGIIGIDTKANEANEILRNLKKRYIKIAVVDTGIQTEHEDFVGVQFLPSKNFADIGSVTTDVNGHGTAVASVLVAMLAGGQEWYSIGSYRVFDSSGQGTYSSLVKAFREAVEVDKVDIINFSGGGGQSLAVEEFLKANPGVLFIFPAGNEYLNSVICPACYHALGNVISVSAIGRSGNMPDWSNKGANLAAPGELMFAAVPKCDTAGTSVRLCDHAAYRFINGTSFSTPCVTAAAAAKLAVVTNPTPVMIKRAVLETVDVQPGLQVQTGGRLNFKKLLEIDKHSDGLSRTGMTYPHPSFPNSWGLPAQPVGPFFLSMLTIASKR